MNRRLFAIALTFALWPIASSVETRDDPTHDIRSACSAWFPDNLSQQHQCLSSEENAHVTLALHFNKSDRERTLVETCRLDWPNNYGKQLLCFDDSWAEWTRVSKFWSDIRADGEKFAEVGLCVERFSQPPPDYDAMLHCALDVVDPI
jgi:hypothetical protein